MGSEYPDAWRPAAGHPGAEKKDRAPRTGGGERIPWDVASPSAYPSSWPEARERVELSSESVEED